MATEYDKRNGFSAQHKVCEMLNAFYKQKQMNYVAEETDEMTDMLDKIDIVVKLGDDIVKKYDVKSTTQFSNISYTTLTQQGQHSPTSSAEANINNIQLIFMFDSENTDTMYIVNMERFYELLSKKELHNGRTKLQYENKDGVIIQYMKTTKTGQTIPATKFYYYDKEKGTAWSYVEHKKKHVDCIENSSGTKEWSFENTSKYAIFTETEIAAISEQIIKID